MLWQLMHGKISCELCGLKSFVCKHLSAQSMVQAHLIKVTESPYPAVVPNHRILDDRRSFYAHIPGAKIIHSQS